MTLRAILLLVLPVFAQSEKWAVIAAGSSGYWNYRHQADACHAYQIMKRSGIPESNIILMMQDDVASDLYNPFPGKLFNKPGDDAVDVYDGCNVDYRGSIVTANLFSSVITGDTSGVPANGKVLKSGPNDKVFINFVDHGGVGLVAFPNGPVLHVETLSENIKTMQSKNMFKEMVFYMEACESGSMFPDLTKDGKVVAVTAANLTSSWGTYCGSDAVVNGKSLSTCLGDLFSISWMEDSESSFEDADGDETLATQIASVSTRVDKSTVMVFGDTSFENEPIGNFENKLQGHRGSPQKHKKRRHKHWNTRDIDVQQAHDAWQHAKGHAAKRAAWKQFLAISKLRNLDESLFNNIVKTACSDVNLIGCVKSFRHSYSSELKDLACHRKLVDTVFEECPRNNFHASPGGWNGFNMRFSQVLVNLCEGQEVLGKDKEKFHDIVKDQCEKNRADYAAEMAKMEAGEFIV